MMAWAISMRVLALVDLPFSYSAPTNMPRLLSPNSVIANSLSKPPNGDLVVVNSIVFVLRTSNWQSLGKFDSNQ
jgi:hypothetical protein